MVQAPPPFRDTMSAMRCMLAALCSLPLLLAGCGDETAELFVDVRTDLAAGGDFNRVTTELFVDEARAPVRSSMVSASTADDYSAGRRVAEFPGLARGTYTVHVTMLLSDDVVAEERLLIQLDSDRAVTIEFEAACTGVVCPGAGDPPDATRCVSGACVAPDVDAGTDAGTDASADTGPDAGALQLLAPSAPLNVNASAILAATGGVGPYRFSLVSGEGTVESGGVLTAPNYGGQMHVRVTDSTEATDEAFVQVGGAALFSLGGYDGTRVNGEVYESIDGTGWTTHTLPLTRGEVAAVVFDDALFLVGGYEMGPGNIDSVLRSETGATDSWTVAGRLPTARGWGGAVVHDGQIIYAGGRENAVYANTDVFASPDGRRWSKIGDLPEATSWGGLATFHDQLFYLGGKHTDGASDAIWTSPDGVAWTAQTATLPEPRAGGAIVVFRGLLWYIGGERADLSRGDQIWNSEDGLAWNDTGFTVPAGFRLAGATVHDGSIWLIGGNTGAYSAAVYYSPDGLLWTRVEDIPHAVDRVGALSFTPR